MHRAGEAARPCPDSQREASLRLRHHHARYRKWAHKCNGASSISGSARTCLLYFRTIRLSRGNPGGHLASRRLEADVRQSSRRQPPRLDGRDRGALERGVEPVRGRGKCPGPLSGAPGSAVSATRHLGAACGSRVSARSRYSHREAVRRRASCHAAVGHRCPSRRLASPGRCS